MTAPKTFVVFTSTDGQPVLVNVDAIEAVGLVHPEIGNVVVSLRGGHAFAISESMEDVRDVISVAVSEYPPE